MPSRRPWIRLYTSFRTDPRIVSLPAEVQVAFIRLLCLAGDSDRPGYIEESPGKGYGHKALAKALGIHPAALERIINTLIEHDVGGLTRLEGGGLLVGKWGSNQPLDASAQERMIRYRAKLRNRNTAVTVTGESREEKNRIEEEKEKREEKEPWAPPAFYKPLSTLPGYRHANHSKHAELLTLACAEASVDPAQVVQGFVTDYPLLRHQYGWSDPCAALKGKPLAIQISKVLNGGTAQPPHKDPPRDAYLKRYGPTAYRGPTGAKIQDMYEAEKQPPDEDVQSPS